VLNASITKQLLGFPLNTDLHVKPGGEERRRVEEEMMRIM
jgi:hypothetical protein